MSSNGNNALLSVRDLRTYFETEDGTVKAVDGISFDLHKGETLGIVGESGSGKSVTNLSIIRLIPQPPGRIVSGEVLFHGQDIMALAEDDVRRIRGKRNPVIFPDPTTALDVTIQAQILELIKKLKEQTDASVILITHDLGVVAGMTDHIIVMYAGKVFEQAPTRELFSCPGNPYTKGLLRSVPDPAHEAGTPLYQIPGLPPDVAHLPAGCPFAPRCDRAEEICTREYPPFVQLTSNHRSLCHFANEVYAESSATS